MSRMMALMLGIVIGAVGVYTAFRYHIVQTDKRWLLVVKLETSLNDAYVDVRDWSLEDWSRHPALANAMIKSGHEDVVKQAAAKRLIDRVLDQIEPKPEQ